MGDITQYPIPYLLFASLHLLMGQFGSAWIYRLRFGGSPLVLYKPGQKTPHMTLTRAMTVPVLIWAAALIVYAFSDTFRATFIGQPLLPIPSLVGWIVALLGLFGMASAQFNMGPSFKVGQDESPDLQPQLVTKGLYKHSRNPVYLFSFLYLLGITLWAPCLLTSLSCAVMGLMMHGLVLQEEKFLHQRLGPAYKAYQQQVRRYL